MSVANGTTKTLTRPARTGSYHPAVWANRLALAVDGKPIFTWLEAERMRLDPQVQFGLRILRAPLYGVTWKTHADNSVVERWIQRESEAIYRRMMPKIVRHFEYGVSCGEITFKNRRSQGKTRVHFADFLEVHPRDAAPFVYDRGPRSGKLACLEVKNVADGHGTVYLDRRHSFWFKGDSEFGEWWGRPRLAGAHQPWFDKGSRHGLNDSIRLYYAKQAFMGPKLFYPPGNIDISADPSTQVFKDAQDHAREIVEKYMNGGVLVLPSTVDDKGAALWRWEDPKAFTDSSGMLEYKKVLDGDILVGLGIPKELVEASTVGSGYSGRAIPAQVFFSSMDEEAQRILEEIDRQILRPLVRLNFGPVGYVIKPDSLAQLVARDPAQAGQPGGGMGGPEEHHDPMRATGPRGGHRIIGPNGHIRYERKGGSKPRVRLSFAGDPAVSPVDARKLWDEADGPMLVPVGAK